jgi:hypothetical protein
MSLVWQSITKYMGLCSAPFLVGQDLHDHGSGPVLNVWGGDILRTGLAYVGSVLSYCLKIWSCLNEKKITKVLTQKIIYDII